MKRQSRMTSLSYGKHVYQGLTPHQRKRAYCEDPTGAKGFFTFKFHWRSRLGDVSCLSTCPTAKKTEFWQTAAAYTLPHWAPGRAGHPLPFGAIAPPLVTLSRTVWLYQLLDTTAQLTAGLLRGEKSVGRPLMFQRVCSPKLQGK